MRALVLPLLLASILAACGSPPSAARPEVSPPPSTTAAPAVSTSPPPAQPKPAASGGSEPKPALADHNTPLRASKLLGAVRALGVDPKKPLATVPDAKKKELMKLFVTALGFADKEECGGCHVGDDYERETRNMKVARKMWSEFVMPLRDAGGGAIFCDSCHAGKAKPLDRGNMDALEKLMETDYQGKLTRADKKDHDCSTCHGPGKDPEPKIIEKLWGIKAK